MHAYHNKTEKYSLNKIHNLKPNTPGAVAIALIGGGGCIFMYSCYARLNTFEINPNDN